MLISRQEIANRASTKLKLVSAPGFGLDLATLAWWLDCPQSQMEFSRIGPIELVHGGAWARSRMLESLRWPYLGQCVIHGRAIWLRLGLPGPVPIRGLTDWEAANALASFQRLAAPLIQGECPLDGAFIQVPSIGLIGSIGLFVQVEQVAAFVAPESSTVNWLAWNPH